ncbi:MAG: hypothetical protein ABEJ40_09460 [Haloarculaceae archaeon]
MVEWEYPTNPREASGLDPEAVHEWRTQFHRDPLLARTTGAYYLALPAHVWDEFADDADADSETWGAVRALHEAQLRRDADDVGAEVDRLDGGQAVVLTRP